jgi:hypothetical protein
MPAAADTPSIVLSCRPFHARHPRRLADVCSFIARRSFFPFCQLALRLELSCCCSLRSHKHGKCLLLRSQQVMHGHFSAMIEPSSSFLTNQYHTQVRLDGGWSWACHHDVNAGPDRFCRQEEDASVSCKRIRLAFRRWRKQQARTG